MKLLKNLKYKLYKYFLHNKLREKEFQPLPMDFAKAKNIGLLFKADSFEWREQVSHFSIDLENKGKSTFLLGYFDSNVKADNFSFHHFTNKEVNWYLHPKGQEIDTFLNQSLDILINLHPIAHPVFEYIVSLSKAHLRVGPVSENVSSYDLMIDSHGKEELSHFIKQVVYLLNKTNTQHETSKL
ncbi:MAG: hypothetical protein GY705_20440 [Bacteroidetes bacterium]|nr:hypothetical protein [Bacteroidota bacterium]